MLSGSNAIIEAFPHIAGYSITEQLHQGPRTAVYRAIAKTASSETASSVIIKLMQQTQPDFSDLIHFRNQYTITKNLPIPGIIRPLSLEPWQNSYALVMEDYGGLSLQQYLKTQSLTLVETLSIAIQLADILHNLTQHRIVHKDIKPANILIHPTSKQIKLIDFSIASQLPKEIQVSQNPNSLEGTLAYLAPEQTGRMNRGIDYRSDFYSLGITLYELLTKELPFASTDPLELVHCHIAISPTPPHQRLASIPLVLSELVLKLMAKNAEDRYQSALGLKHDLEKCLHELKDTGSIRHFELGQQDICDRFLIPEKLYGRNTEVQQLLSAFERIANGPAELMLVAGFSGIGKTAVISEIHKPITQRQGYFIKGKFDQFNRNIPFSAFVQAFRNLIGQLLSESDQQLAHWKQQILQAVGENGQVIIDVIPELETIIGKQPPAPTLSGSAAQNRFNLLLSKFIQVFAQKEHPLVLFLDDLQWADTASLDLLKRLITEADTGHLLALGAYRDNEVFPAHPLMLTLKDIANQGGTTHTLTLGPLIQTDLTQLVADTLRCTPAAAAPLSKLIYQKTQGNPFFSTQFLTGLHENDWIEFNPNLGHWQCDLISVRQLALTNDVVKFMVDRLKQLPKNTQQVLKLAACIGNRFNLATLAIVCSLSSEAVATHLWAGLQEGFIVPENQTYKFFQKDNQSEETQSEETQPAKNPTEDNPIEDNQPEAPRALNYRFLHDRIQQAAYSLIPEAEKQATHLKIGQLLQQELSTQTQQQQIFEIVNQLNLGQAKLAELPDSAQQQQQLAQLNLQAGQKAKRSAAHEAAQNYCEIGIALLPATAWQTHYNLIYGLHREGSEAAYLSGDFDQAEALYKTAIAHARTPLEKAVIYRIQVTQYQLQGRHAEAIVIQRQSLRLLGWDMPTTTDDIQASLDQQLEAVSTFRQSNSIRSILEHDKMENANVAEMLRILQILFYTAWLDGQTTLAILAVAKMTSLSLQYGNSEMSPFGYVGYGMISVIILKDAALAEQFGAMAVELCDQFDNADVTGMTNFLFAADVHSWSRPLRSADFYYDNAFKASMEAGNWLTVSFAIMLSGSDRLTYGKNLKELHAIAQTHVSFLKRIKSFDNLDAFTAGVLQPVRQLLGLTTAFSFNDKNFSEAQYLKKYADTPYHLVWFYSVKIRHAYLFNQTDDYANLIPKLSIIENTVATHAKVPSSVFYVALMHLALIDSETDHTQQQPHWKALSALEERLIRWERDCPENIRHKRLLIQAEKARLNQHPQIAIDLYQQAISQAGQQNYGYEAALANELAAKFYQQQNNNKAAADHIKAAYHGYDHWQAQAKKDHLKACYPELLSPRENSITLDTSAPNTSAPEKSTPNTSTPNNAVSEQSLSSSSSFKLNVLESLSNINTPNLILHTATQTSDATTNINTSLDLAAVLQASQAISGIIELDQLLKKLTHIILQNSGGDHCTLLLPQANNEWHVKAITDSHSTTLCSAPLSGNPNVPTRLIQYVKNTKNTVIIDNLETALPVIDRYFTEQQPKSILCLPLLNQTKLIGIFCLTNQATTGVFTKDRLIVLNFLCTQAAISLENARLYQQTQTYAQQLEASQLQIVQSEKMASLGNLVAGVAHEINNPIGFLNGSIQNAQDYIQDLQSQLDLYQQHYPNPVAPIQENAKDIGLDFICDDLPKLLYSMQGATNRITSISTSLRTFSRADTEHKVSADIHEGLDSTLLILKYRLKSDEHRPAIKIIKDYGELPIINCFPGRLNQVFMNLLANAIDVFDEAAQQSSFEALEDNPQSITVKTAVLPNALPQQIEIRIQDNGKGIPEEVKAKIFDHLFTTKGVGKGTGLGLAIAQQIIVEAHSGTIEVTSEPEAGTEFCIRLPF